jgi:hypothetical protein
MTAVTETRAMSNATAARTFGVKHVTILLCATFASAFGCQRDQSAAALADAAAAGGSGDIRVSLAHPYDLKHDDFELVFAVPNTVDGVSVCEVRVDATCAAGGPGVFGSKLVFATDARKFFKANATALLESGLMLKLLAFDKSGAQVDARMISFTGNGSLQKGATSQPTATPTPQPSTPPPGNGDGDNGFDPDDSGQDDSGDDSGYDPGYDPGYN